MINVQYRISDVESETLIYLCLGFLIGLGREGHELQAEEQPWLDETDAVLSTLRRTCWC